MPASRIAFAIGDLMSEIKALLPRDGEPGAELRLSADAYAAVKREIEHHYGQQLTGSPISENHITCGEQFKIGGMVISAIFEQADA